MTVVPVQELIVLHLRKLLLQMGALVLGLPLLIQQLAHSNLLNLKMT